MSFLSLASEESFWMTFTTPNDIVTEWQVIRHGSLLLVDFKQLSSLRAGIEIYVLTAKSFLSLISILTNPQSRRVRGRHAIETLRNTPCTSPSPSPQHIPRLSPLPPQSSLFFWLLLGLISPSHHPHPSPHPTPNPHRPSPLSRAPSFLIGAPSIILKTLLFLVTAVHCWNSKHI